MLTSGINADFEDDEDKENEADQADRTLAPSQYFAGTKWETLSKRNALKPSIQNPLTSKKPVSNVKPDKLSTDTAGSVRTQLLPTVEARFVPLKQPDTQLKQIADLIRAKIDC